MFCAGGIQQQATCKGDSGGPVIVRRKEYDVLVGVTSWVTSEANNCGANGVPVVYGKVTHALNFIYQHVPVLREKWTKVLAKHPYLADHLIQY